MTEVIAYLKVLGLIILIVGVAYWLIFGVYVLQHFIIKYW